MNKEAITVYTMLTLSIVFGIPLLIFGLVVVFATGNVILVHGPLLAGGGLAIILIGLAGLGWRKWQHSRLPLQQAKHQQEIDRLRAEAEIDLLRAEAEVKRRSIAFDGVDNAAIIDATGQIVQIRGNYQEHPALGSLHHHNDVNAFARMLELGRTTVTPEDEEWSLPGACTFSDVLRDFIPSAKQIYLAELAGSKLITPGVTDLCHVANAGATGGGKSVGIRLIAAQLCYVGVRVAILNPHYTSYDMKSGEDWTPIENKLYKPPVRDFPGIKNWLKWAAEVELRRRLDRYAESQSWGGPLFIVVDELPSITKHIPEAMGWMADILREGRKVDLFLITAAQDMLCKTLGNSGGAIRDYFRTAIYIGGDATTARVLLDVKGTVDDGGLGKGIVMLRSSQCKQATLARVPYVDNEALYQLLGPSTFDFSKVVDADPVTDEIPPMEALPSNGVSEVPLPKEQKKEATLNDAILAWNAGYNSVRTMAEYLGVTRYQAETFCKQIKSMQVSD